MIFFYQRTCWKSSTQFKVCNGSKRKGSKTGGWSIDMLAWVWRNGFWLSRFSISPKIWTFWVEIWSWTSTYLWPFWINWSENSWINSFLSVISFWWNGICLRKKVRFMGFRSCWLRCLIKIMQLLWILIILLSADLCSWRFFKNWTRLKSLKVYKLSLWSRKCHRSTGFISFFLFFERSMDEGFISTPKWFFRNFWRILRRKFDKIKYSEMFWVPKCF